MEKICGEAEFFARKRWIPFSRKLILPLPSIIAQHSRVSQRNYLEGHFGGGQLIPKDGKRAET
jgi:hypothetical protein